MRWKAITAGLVLAAAAALLAFAAGLPTPAVATAGVTGLCAGWWVLEAVPIPVTSLVPFFAFPLLGIVDHKTVAAAYGDTVILLLMGGFMLSTAIEKSGAHRRLALGMVSLTGGGGRAMIFGFMAASALCSMWISNTATVLMLLPVALAALEKSDDRNLEIALLLGIAYAASIGGIGTPIGTPPNAYFIAAYQDKIGGDYSFLEWMRVGVPIVVIFVPLTWLYLTRRVKDSEAVALPTVGPWTTAEKRVLLVFGITAAAWVLRAGPAGGWTGLIGVTGIGDATVALTAVVVMFLVPDGEEGALLDWETASKIPWGLLILFGGGIAIARGFDASGLSDAIGIQLRALAALPTVLMVVLLCLGVTFLTELTSNTATTALLMTVLPGAAQAAQIDPRLLMIPAAISASCAFMLPVATAPNAIVFGTKRVDMSTMVREGFALNLIGVVVIALAVLVLL